MVDKMLQCQISLSVWRVYCILYTIAITHPPPTTVTAAVVVITIIVRVCECLDRFRLPVPSRLHWRRRQLLPARLTWIRLSASAADIVVLLAAVTGTSPGRQARAKSRQSGRVVGRVFDLVRSPVDGRHLAWPGRLSAASIYHRSSLLPGRRARHDWHVPARRPGKHLTCRQSAVDESRTRLRAPVRVVSRSRGTRWRHRRRSATQPCLHTTCMIDCCLLGEEGRGDGWGIASIARCVC